MEVITKSAEETKSVGREIANNLGNRQRLALKNTLEKAEWTPARWRKKGAFILALTGDLGSGKTTFVQGLAEGLGIKQRIISPTFIIMRKYDVPKLTAHCPLLTTLFHVDLYRLEDNIGEEFKNLGIDEVFSDPENIVTIEWAEKMRDFLPDSTIWVRFKNIGEDKRRITVDQVN